MNPEKIKLKLILRDAIQGFSKITLRNGFIFLKHLDLITSSESDSIGYHFYHVATKEGLPTEPERVEILKSDGSWTIKDDNEIRDLKFYISGLRQTKSKLALISQVAEIRKLLTENEEKVRVLEDKKINLIGLTAEIYAQKKTNEALIQRSGFKDSQLTIPYYSEEEFDELEPKELQEVVAAYNECLEGFSSINLKKVALSPAFMNQFYLCEDNPMTFYGRAVCHLSFIQSELFNFGRVFKSILSDPKKQVPDELLDSPDKLLEWAETGRNAEKLLENDKGGAQGIVGATRDDLKALGIEHNRTKNLHDEMRKQGKTQLSMDDLIKMEFGT